MLDERNENANILIADEKPANIRLLERILQPAGYKNLKSTTDSRRVFPLYVEFQPDIILLDFHMPHLGGLDVLEQLRSNMPDDSYLPVLVLAADITPEARQRALSLGAKDFLAKPVDPSEVLLRVRNLLETRFLYLRLQNQNQTLEYKVRERTHELAGAKTEMLERLAIAAEYRDDNTGQHTQRVGHLSSLIAQTLGFPDARVEVIRRAAALHDIGKIGIPDRILLKPGKLTPDEFEQMKNHTTIGAGILSGSNFHLLKLAEQIAFYHHEHWDGHGYHQLSGEGILLEARIVAVADVYDVLTHDRPYKKAWPVEAALTEVGSQSGRHFDPRIVEAFLQAQSREAIFSLDEAASEVTYSVSNDHLVETRGFGSGGTTILIVDDCPDNSLLLKSILRAGGHQDILTAGSAEDAFRYLGFTGAPANIGLVLMDILMPGLNGVEACFEIKSKPMFSDLPIIMVTGQTSMADLQSAFAAGANDYVTKPVNRVELLARVHSVLKLKEEIDCRKAREKDLLEMTKKVGEINRKLLLLSSVDGLTGISNRRSFDESLDRCWRRARRDAKPVSLIMIDVDCFKLYNDTYGHQAGDECLKRVASAIQTTVQRPDDVVARYGGEEFAVILPGTDFDGAGIVAENLRAVIEALEIRHSRSSASGYLTITAGTATAVPDANSRPEALVLDADEALYRAKLAGRNRVSPGVGAEVFAYLRV